MFTKSTKVSYNQKRDGYSGAFGGLGDNLKELGKNVTKAPTYSSTKGDKKTGEITKGAQVGTVGDKLSLMRKFNMLSGSPDLCVNIKVSLVFINLSIRICKLGSCFKFIKS